MTASAYQGPESFSESQQQRAAILLLLARICFASNFLLFGARKFSDPSQIFNLSVSQGYPGFLVYPAMVLQLAGGLCILFGFQTRIAAAVFAWFCIVAPSMFWLNNLSNLTRDYAAAGGFLLLMLFGPGRYSIDAQLEALKSGAKAYVPRFLSKATVVSRVSLVARILVALPFVADFFNKLLHLDAHQALFRAKGLPAELMYAVMLAELVFGLMLMAGYRTRLAALVLLGWTVLQAATLNYPGWNLAFADGKMGEAMFAIFKHRSNATFFKDVAMVAALLIVIAWGPGSISGDARARMRMRPA